MNPFLTDEHGCQHHYRNEDGVRIFTPVEEAIPDSPPRDGTTDNDTEVDAEEDNYTWYNQRRGYRDPDYNPYIDD